MSAVVTPSNTLSDDTLEADLNKLLQARRSDPTATVRVFQLDIVRRLVAGQSIIYIAATGEGKSEAYFLACIYMRLNNPRLGPMILLSPQKVLAKEQCDRAKAFGLDVKHLDGDTNNVDQSNLKRALGTNNTLDLIVTTYDQLGGYALKASHPMRVGPLNIGASPNSRNKWDRVCAVVLDEADCISQSGYDFRPILRTMWGDLAKFTWFRSVQLLALTATLTHQAEADIRLVVTRDWQHVVGPMYRRNITPHIVHAKTDPQRLDWLLQHMSNNTARHSIVFAKSKVDCTRYAQALTNISLSAAAIHADLSKEAQAEIIAKFKSGEIRTLVSTKLIGRGFDKQDLRDVIHLYTPNDISQFLQEIGRAGRDGSEANTYLLPTIPFFGGGGWINAVVHITKHLVRCPNLTDTEEVLRAMLTSKQHKDHDIKAALRNGTRAFERIEASASYRLKPDWREEINAISNWAQSCKSEADYMKDYGQGLQCAWTKLLGYYDQQLPNDAHCMCVPHCNPTAETTQVDEFAGDDQLYATYTPNGLPVLVLGKKNEAVDMSSERMQMLLYDLLPDLANVPSVWQMTCIPDRRQRVAGDAQAIAQAVPGLEYCEYLLRDPQYPSIATMSGIADKAKNLEKYSLKGGEAPTVGAVLLYDDVINTGMTMDHCARQLQANGVRVVGLVKEAYQTLDLRPITSRQVDAALPLPAPSHVEEETALRDTTTADQSAVLEQDKAVSEPISQTLSSPVTSTMQGVRIEGTKSSPSRKRPPE